MGELFLVMIVLTFVAGIYALLTPDPFTKIVTYIVLILAWAGYLLNTVYTGVQNVVAAFQFGNLTGTVSIVLMLAILGGTIYYAQMKVRSG